jgi:hypothetical protein
VLDSPLAVTEDGKSDTLLTSVEMGSALLLETCLTTTDAFDRWDVAFVVVAASSSQVSIASVAMALTTLLAAAGIGASGS